MTIHHPTEQKRCPSRDDLVRHRQGYCAPEEVERLKAHFKECPTCEADDASLEFIACELLTAHADRAALDEFQPAPAHARTCWQLKNRLPAITQSLTPPDNDVLAHFDDCVFCRATLQTLPGPGEAQDRPTARTQMLAALLAPALRRAQQKVAAAVVWAGPSLVERLVARVAKTGRVIAAGLEGLMPQPLQPIGAALGPERTLDAGQAAWQLPVSEANYSMSLRLRPSGPGEWEVDCRITSRTQPQLAETAYLDVRYSDGRSFMTDRLATFLAHPLRLKSGEWLLRLEVGPDVREVSVSLESEP